MRGKIENLLYEEKLSSNRTEILFLALMILFGLLFVWRSSVSGFEWIGIVFGCFSLLFLFYSINYRALIIRFTPEFLILTFGIFTWRVPLDNIQDSRLDDEIPPFMKYGGAGIHFMFIRNRYRASFNFLEYPRVVIALRKKAGPVIDISFSTNKPEEVIRLIQAALERETYA